MTRECLLKRIAYFERRMKETIARQQDAEGKRAYAGARSKCQQAKRMLLCLDATGSVAGWVNYKLDGE